MHLGLFSETPNIHSTRLPKILKKKDLEKYVDLFLRLYKKNGAFCLARPYISTDSPVAYQYSFNLDEGHTETKTQKSEHIF